MAAPPVFFPAVALPQGDGSYVVSHGKPVVDGWIGTREAMKIVGYKSRASIHEEIIPHPLAKKHLRWKLSPGGGKLLINRASLMRFLEAVAAARQNPPRTPQAALTMSSPPAPPKRTPTPLRNAAGGIVAQGQTLKTRPRPSDGRGIKGEGFTSILN